MARVPGVGTATRLTGRSLRVGAGLVRYALPPQTGARLRSRTAQALSGTWQASLDAVVSEQLIERTVDLLLTQGVAERIAERVLSGPELERILDKSLDQRRLEEIVARALESPSADRLVAHVVESPGFERLVLSIARSETFDRLLDRALYSEELHRVVTHIAESEEVRGALTQQSAGLADEVADQVRVRAMAAGALLERFARSVIRRSPRDEHPESDVIE